MSWKLKNKNATTTTADFRAEAGFKQLYEQNVNRLFTVCYSRIRNREDSEEIVHDIFRSIWERRDSIKNQDGSIEGYLVRSVKLKSIALLVMTFCICLAFTQSTSTLNGSVADEQGGAVTGKGVALKTCWTSMIFDL